MDCARNTDPNNSFQNQQLPKGGISCLRGITTSKDVTGACFYLSLTGFFFPLHWIKLCLKKFTSHIAFKALETYSKNTLKICNRQQSDIKK